MSSPNKIRQKYISRLNSQAFYIEQNGAIKVVKSDGSEVDLLKLNGSNAALLMGNEVANKTALDQEIIDRQAGDADAKAYADQKIADLVNSAPELLDTLKELADAIANDPNFAASIGSQIGQLQSGLAAEIARAEAAEAALSGRVTTVENDLNALEGVVQGNLDLQQSDIDGLRSDVDAAAGRLDALEPKVTTLEGEMVEAQADIVALEGRMTTAEGDINALEAEVDQERSDRQAADDLKYDKSGGEIFGNVYINGLGAGINRLTVKGGALFSTSNPNTAGVGMVEINPQGTILARSAVYARSSADGEPYTGVLLNSNNGKVTMQKSGGLPADVTEASQATTKKYVDDQDASKVQESKDYADSKVSEEAAAREAEDLTFLKLDGSRPMEGAFQLGSNELNGSGMGRSVYLNWNGLSFGDDAQDEWLEIIKNINGEKDLIISHAGVELRGEFTVVNTMNAPSPTANSHVANKEYVDAGDDAAKSYADAAVLVEKERAELAEAGLQSAIDVEKGRVDAILDASQADKDSFAEIVSLINSVDLENDNALASIILAEQTAREEADAALDARLDIVEPKVSTLETGLAQELIDRAAGDAANLSRIETLEGFAVAQTIYVSKNGNDTTGTGGQHKPFLTLTKAFAMITDASPTKRYVVRVAAGAYTEASVALPSNVFVIGEQKETVRITGAVSMGAWTQDNSGSDDRSGFSMVTLLSAANFNWQTAKSRAGKLYMNEVVFGSTLNLYGYDNAIAQAQFDSCVIFNAVTISGINVGVFSNNVCYNNVTLNQHPTGGMASILAASGGYCSGTVRFNTTVNDFGRRSSGFLRAFPSENLIVDGSSSYADADLISQGKSSTQKLNSGNLVALNPRISHDIETQMIKPLNTNSHNMGDWGKQWMFNFGYVHASSGSDLYLSSLDSSYDAAGSSAGYAVNIESDGYGLKPNVNGGDINLTTGAVSGTGVRGKIKFDAREIDASSKKITSLADGSASGDAVNKGQLDAEVSRAQAAEVALDDRLDILEAMAFYKESKQVGSGDLSYVELAKEAKPYSIKVFVGRLALHEGQDFSVSVVGGKSRLTWMGDFMVGGEEGIEEGMKLFFEYYC